MRSAPPRREPTEARAQSRLAQLGIGTRELQRVEWPGRSDVSCLIRLLTCDEVQGCHAAAYVRFRELGLPVEPVTMALFEDECVTQILARALRDAERPEDLPFAVDAADIREHTTVNERAAVFGLYADFAAERDPDPDTLPPSLVHELEDLVKKKGVAYLRGLVSSALATSAPTSGSQPESSPTGSSESSS